MVSDLWSPAISVPRPSGAFLADLPALEAMHTDPSVMATLGGMTIPEELSALSNDHWQAPLAY